jgi:hypothetical protein
MKLWKSQNRNCTYIDDRLSDRIGKTLRVVKLFFNFYKLVRFRYDIV